MSGGDGAAGAALPVPCRSARSGTRHAPRRSSGMAETDRVLGGGLVEGSLILLGGDPGIGKSTLALQLGHAVGASEAPALYCAGEESPAQLALRADRLGCLDDRVVVVGETDVSGCVEAIATLRPPARRGRTRCRRSTTRRSPGTPAVPPRSGRR